MYLVKSCSECGTTESLISSDAERYMMKHGLDDEHTCSGCMLKCIGCGKKKERASSSSTLPTAAT